MLLNLDFWREHNLEFQLLDYAKKNKSKILWQDQDIVNSVLFEDIKELVKENNEFKILEAVKDYGGNDRVVICRFQEK